MAKVVEVALFEGGQSHYIPNSTVKGSVSLNIVKDKNYKRLTVKLYGRAQVGWTEGAGSNTTHYSNLIVYVEKDTELWNRDVHGELLPGSYTYPFEYLLPDNIPPSFEAQKGQVRYEIEARLSKDGFLNSGYRAMVPIPVIDPTDQLSPCMEVASMEETTRVKFCCFDSGSVTVTCNLQRTGFSPGDSIPVSIYIENQSKNTVWINVFLYREEIFTATGGHKTANHRYYGYTTSPRVPPRGLQSFESQSLLIPEDVPNTFVSCSCINLVYSILMRVLSPMGTGKDLKMPIVVAKSSTSSKTF